MKLLFRKQLYLSGLIAVVLGIVGLAGIRLTAQNSTRPSAKMVVVTTVAPLTNIVSNVGGDKIILYGIIPEGTDSHTFEPAPSDAKILSQADLIIVNGLHLEIPTEKLAQSNLKPGAHIYRLGDNALTEKDWLFDFSFPKENGDPNPHVWMNPQYAIRYVELVRDELVRYDPANVQYYRIRAEIYLTLLNRLDQGIEEAVQTIPPTNRRLLTYHDSWAYFARRYKMEVIGAIQPSDFKEPTSRDVATLITQIRREHVPAIFGSEVFPSKVLDQIAQEAGVKWVGTLRDDDLPGQPGTNEHTYVGMMLEDMSHMIVPLGGSIAAIANIDPTNIVP